MGLLRAGLSNSGNFNDDSEKTREVEQKFLDHPNPTVLSCGGIYIPRKRTADKIIYQILNLANAQEPTSGSAGEGSSGSFGNKLHGN